MTIFHLIVFSASGPWIISYNFRPLNSNFRIIPCKSAFIVSMVEVITFIAKLGNVG